VITRAVGTEADVDVDTFEIRPEPGDLFLICSDGLTDMVDDETIIRAVEKHRANLDEAAKALVGAANRVGGEDNITVVFFEVTEGEDTAVTAAAPAVDGEVDEDTLSGLEGVPTVETREPEEPKRRGRALPVAAALAVLLFAAAAILWLLDNL
jgi:serine/threonine protein phosphatase PrpC